MDGPLNKKDILAGTKFRAPLREIGSDGECYGEVPPYFLFIDRLVSLFPAQRILLNTFAPNKFDILGYCKQSN